MVKLYELMEKWSQIMEVGNTPPIDIFPWLKYAPERFLGNWRTRALSVKKEMHALYEEYLDRVIERRAKHVDKKSFMDAVLDENESGKGYGFTRQQLCFLGGGLMEGGSDTSSSVILSFLQAMTRWPEVLHKAHAEIDRVVGEDRSPSWEDYGKMPYIAATVKEAMRWRPILPLAFPHCLAEGIPPSPH